MNILLTGAFDYTKDQIVEIEKLGYNVIFIQNELEQIDINPENIDVVVCNSLFLYNDIEKFKNLKLIQTTSAGLDRIPLEYTENNNIKVYSAGDTYSIPMAEFVVMQILNIYKKNKFFIENQKIQKWVKNSNLLELSNKKVLIMGFGNVGYQIAKRLNPFVEKIYAYDIRKITNNQVTYVEEYNDVITDIDIVIVTLPLVRDTKNIIDETFMNKLKDGVSIVNISRGKLINEKDLITNLKNDKFLGVALDVFEEEPLNAQSELWGFDNVYLTPHNSYVSAHNNERLFELIYRRLIGGIK